MTCYSQNLAHISNVAPQPVLAFLNTSVFETFKLLQLLFAIPFVTFCAFKQTVQLCILTFVSFNIALHSLCYVQSAFIVLKRLTMAFFFLQTFHYFTVLHSVTLEHISANISSCTSVFLYF